MNIREKLFQSRLKRIQKRGERYKKIKELKDTYAAYMPEKKQKKVSNIMLVTIVIAIVGYFVANFILQYTVGVEISPTLTTCWFSFWGCEIVAITTIKVTKVHKESNVANIDADSGNEI